MQCKRGGLVFSKGRERWSSRNLPRNWMIPNSEGYKDRDKALGEFGRKYSSDLVAMEEQDHTIEDVVTAAKIGPPESWAKAIRNGMNVQDRLQILEHRVGEIKWEEG